MGRLFNINSKWPLPLKPSEYVRRQFHVQFADDPVAVAGPAHHRAVDTIIWGNDYPHAEGTFRGSEECIAENFVGRLRRGPRRDPRRHPGQGRRLRREQEAGGRAAAEQDGELTHPDCRTPARGTARGPEFGYCGVISSEVTGDIGAVSIPTQPST